MSDVTDITCAHDMRCSECGEPAPTWISVDDELPGHSDLVLSWSYDVWSEKYRVEINRCSTYFKSTSSEFTGFPNKATHWMPLPKPPEQDV